MLRTRGPRLLLLLLVVVVGLFVGPLLVDGLPSLSHPNTVLAAPPLQTDAADPQAPQEIINCAIREIGVLGNRVHVLCWTGAGAIVYFATPTSNAAFANRVLSLLLTAEATGKHVGVGYSPLADGSTFGCVVSNCRPIVYVMLLD